MSPSLFIPLFQSKVSVSLDPDIVCIRFGIRSLFREIGKTDQRSRHVNLELRTKNPVNISNLVYYRHSVNRVLDRR